MCFRHSRKLKKRTFSGGTIPWATMERHVRMLPHWSHWKRTLPTDRSFYKAGRQIMVFAQMYFPLIKTLLFRYIIESRAVDRRHAGNNSVAAEKVGLHVALQALYRAGIPVAEVVTDEHTQIVADMSK